MQPHTDPGVKRPARALPGREGAQDGTFDEIGDATGPRFTTDGDTIGPLRGPLTCAMMLRGRAFRARLAPASPKAAAEAEGRVWQFGGITRGGGPKGIRSTMAVAVAGRELGCSPPVSESDGAPK